MEEKRTFQDIKDALMNDEEWYIPKEEREELLNSLDWMLFDI